MIKFSIVIPLYNKSAYITKTLDSIKNQNYQDYEVVIVNDGSTDNSKEIVEDFIEKLNLEIKSKFKDALLSMRRFPKALISRLNTATGV